MINKSYLEITYRQGRPFAAYLYLQRRPGDQSARIERHGSWLMDFTADGRAIGIEFTDGRAVDLAEINRVLARVNQPMLSEADLVPLVAA